MKKITYIVLFTILGFLLQLLLHSILEFIYIRLLVGDFEIFGFGLSWSNWFLVHYIFTVTLLVLGVSFGLWQGIHWWGILYDDKGRIKVKRKGLFFKKYEINNKYEGYF